MNTNPLEVATIASEAQVDHAIATLVLAFVTDPVARWMYDDPHQYLRHIPRLFRALGTSSFEAGAAQRTSKPKSPRSSSRRKIIGRSSPIGTYH